MSVMDLPHSNPHGRAESAAEKGKEKLVTADPRIACEKRQQGALGQ